MVAYHNGPYAEKTILKCHNNIIIIIIDSSLVLVALSPGPFIRLKNWETLVMKLVNTDSNYGHNSFHCLVDVKTSA